MIDRKSTRLNSSHDQISYAVFCLKKKKTLGVDDAQHDVVDVGDAEHGFLVDRCGMDDKRMAPMRRAPGPADGPSVRWMVGGGTMPLRCQLPQTPTARPRATSPATS